ncbi:MAG TPA: hypothetical protein VL832_17710 [Puia sp.]|nr:hypothetical protein [Puia sp.]
MKKKPAFSAIIIAGILLIGPACNKWIDYMANHPVVGHCQIRQFSFVDRFGGADTMNFTYNSWDDPVAGLRPGPRTGAPNFFFRYDRQHRLTELIGAYGMAPLEQGVESWNKYFYDGSGRIVKDSLYFFPDIVDGHPTHGEFGTTSQYWYEYDSRDRISKVTWLIEGSSNPTVTTYTYDPNGNLVGPAAYDNKLSFRLTNKIWMFLDRNYSINNPAIAAYTYNQTGLPTTIDCFPGNSAEFMTVPSTSLSYTKAVIGYNCR